MIRWNGRGRGMSWKRAWAGRMTPLVVAALLLRVLLPHGIAAAPAAPVPAAPAVHGHAGHTAGYDAAHDAAHGSVHDTAHGAQDHASGAQGCHFCRIDLPLFPIPAAPALGPKLRPAPAARPAGEPPPRRRDLRVRLRARAPPLPA
jgi:hypothetical protein